eukprot:CFRG2203T1
MGLEDTPLSVKLVLTGKVTKLPLRQLLEENISAIHKTVLSEWHGAPINPCPISSFTPTEILNFLRDHASGCSHLWLVFDSFEFTEFEKIHVLSQELKNVHVRLFGFPVLMTAVHTKFIPDVEYPVFYTTLRNLSICTAGIDKSDKALLTEMIYRMGGEYQGHLLHETTHLVSDSVIHQKYKVAFNGSKAIVKSSWVEACWRASEIEYQEYLGQSEIILPIVKPLGIAQSQTKYWQMLGDIDIDRMSHAHRLLPFAGLRVGVTGLELEERKSIQKIVNMNGGAYTGEMSRECTHMIASEVKLGTIRKYEVALFNKIHIVGVGWVSECVAEGGCLDEKLYSLVSRSGELENDTDFTIKCAGKEHHVSTARFYKDTKCVGVDDGVGEDARKGKENSVANVSNARTREILPGIGKIVVHDSFRKLPPDVSASVSGAGVDVGDTPRTTVKSGRIPTLSPPTPEQSTSIAVRLSTRMLNVLSNIELLQQAFNAFNASSNTVFSPEGVGSVLPGASVFLLGLTSGSLNSGIIRKVLCRTGASRFAQLNRTVSHVIVAGDFALGSSMDRAKNVKLLQRIMDDSCLRPHSHTSSCTRVHAPIHTGDSGIRKNTQGHAPAVEHLYHLVSLDWLLDCCIQQKHLPEHDYQISVRSRLLDMGSSTNMEIVTVGTESETGIVGNTVIELAHSSKVNGTDEWDGEFQPLLNSQDTCQGTADVWSKDLDGVKVKGKYSQEHTINEPTGESTETDDEIICIFNDSLFYVHGFKNEEIDNIRKSLMERGGIMACDAKQTNDNFQTDNFQTSKKAYFVLPALHGREVRSHAISMVTGNVVWVNELWLEDCINTNELLPVIPLIESAKHCVNTNYSYEYIPLMTRLPTSMPNVSSLFKGVIICASQISVPRREFLATVVGYYCAGEFSADLTRSCTYLVCEKTEGAKYSKAREWGVYCVNMQWVLDCLMQSKVLPVDPNVHSVSDAHVRLDLEEKIDEDMGVQVNTKIPVDPSKDLSTYVVVADVDVEIDATMRNKVLSPEGTRIHSTSRDVIIDATVLDEAEHNDHVCDRKFVRSTRLVSESSTPRLCRQILRHEILENTSTQIQELQSHERTIGIPINSSNRGTKVLGEVTGGSHRSELLGGVHIDKNVKMNATPASNTRSRARKNATPQSTSTPGNRRTTSSGKLERTPLTGAHGVRGRGGENSYERVSARSDIEEIEDADGGVVTAGLDDEDWDTLGTNLVEGLASNTHLKQSGNATTSDMYYDGQDDAAKDHILADVIIHIICPRTQIQKVPESTQNFKNVFKHEPLNSADRWYDLAGRMGGKFVYQYEEIESESTECESTKPSSVKITHVFPLTSGCETEAALVGAELGVPVVSVDWLSACYETGERLEILPYIVNNIREQQTSGNKETGMRKCITTGNVKEKADEDMISKSKTCTSDIQIGQDNSVAELDADANDGPSLADAMNRLVMRFPKPNAQKTSRRLSSRRTSSRSHVGDIAKIEGASIPLDDSSDGTSALLYRNTNAEILASFKSKSIGSDVEIMLSDYGHSGDVVYDDMVGRQQIDKLIEERRRANSRFHLSAMSQNEKAKMVGILKSLNIQILSSNNSDPSCTHLIVRLPTGSEKYLAACAAGIWVLRMSYILDCQKEKKMIDELPYAWDDSPQDKLGPEKRRLARAYAHWRVVIEKQRGNGLPAGAFVGWKVLLLTKKKDIFVRLILAGGGEIIDEPTTLYSDATLRKAKYLFVDQEFQSTIDAAFVRSRGVECLSPEYIYHFLLDVPDLPSMEDFRVKAESLHKLKQVEPENDSKTIAGLKTPQRKATQRQMNTPPPSMHLSAGLSTTKIITTTATEITPAGINSNMGHVVPEERDGSDVTPVFLIHGGSGVVAYGAPIGQYLHKRAFYGIQLTERVANITKAATAHGDDALTALATEYVKAVKLVRPYGPYALAGNSLGALLAFEMTSIIEADGEVVERVFPMDMPVFEFNKEDAYLKATDYSQKAPILFASMLGHCFSKDTEKVDRLLAGFRV